MGKFHFRLSSYLFHTDTLLFSQKHIPFLCGGIFDPFSLLVLAFMNRSSEVHSLKHYDLLVTVPLETMRSHTRFLIMSTVPH